MALLDNSMPDARNQVTLALMKKPARIYVVLLFVVLGLALESFQNPHPFRAWVDSWSELFTWHHWRNHWHIVFFAAQILPGIALIIYGAIFYIRGQRKAKAKAKAKADWTRDLAALVDVDEEVKDRDCLFEYLEPNERQKLFYELRRMPRGSRSLRKAVELVDPGFFDDTPL
jgi:hypothetical protein